MLLQQEDLRGAASDRENQTTRGSVPMIGGLGFGEMVLIFFVLLLFGAKRLPELASGIGKGIHTPPGDGPGAVTRAI